MFRASLALLFFIILNSSAYALDTYNACLKNVLDVVTKHSEKLDLIKHAHQYHDMIHQPLVELSEQGVANKFESALSHLQPWNPSFPKDEFVSWYHAHPVTPAELDALRAQNKTVGDLLHERALQFEKTKESIHFEKATEELNEKLAELRRICGEDPVCHEKGVKEFVNKNEKKLFSCLRSDAVTRKAVITGFVVSNAGMAISQHKKGVKNFPYEILANSVLWTPILGEIGCKNKARASADQVGADIPEKPTLRKRFANFGKSWWSYMWPASPLNELSYMAFHLGAAKFIRGEEVNLEPEHLAKQFGMYIVWDAVGAVPRSVLLLDPLYNRNMPKYLTPVIDKLVKNETIGKVVYSSVEGAVRFGVGAANTRIFTWWENSVLKPVVDGRPEVGLPGGNIQKLDPADTASANRPAPITSAPPMVTPQKVKPVVSKLSCATLKKTYDACINRCIDENPKGNVELAAESTKYHTPTCKVCIGAIDAYELKCGSYW